MWGHYLVHGTLEAQRFQAVEVALGGSHLVWFWWWKAHTSDARWVDFVMTVRHCFLLFARAQDLLWGRKFCDKASGDDDVRHLTTATAV